MLTKKEHARLVKRGKNQGGLCLHIISLIRIYTPELDKEIRRLLAVQKKQSSWMEHNQWFVERLCEFWNAKINFHLDAIWNQIRNRKVNADEKMKLLAKLQEIDKLIDFAVDEFKNVDCYPYAETFFFHQNLRLYLQSISSILEDPLVEGEARRIDEVGSIGNLIFEQEKIMFSTMIEEKNSVIPNLPKLADDDLAGHALRSAGYLDAWPMGRIIISGWNLPVYENEAGAYFVHIEKMLVEFGGCPRGFVYDNKEFRNNKGYNIHLKTCEDCYLKDFCPGDGCLEDRSLGILAKKLQVAWECRDDIRQAIPGFKNKLLEKK